MNLLIDQNIVNIVDWRPEHVWLRIENHCPFVSRLGRKDSVEFSNQLTCILTPTKWCCVWTFVNPLGMANDSTQRWPMTMRFLSDEPNLFSVTAGVVIHGGIAHGFARADTDVVAPTKCDGKVETDCVHALTNKRG